jgi:hypothetical protein
MNRQARAHRENRHVATVNVDYRATVYRLRTQRIIS